MKIGYALLDSHREIFEPCLTRALPLIPREYYEIVVSEDPTTEVLAIIPKTEYRLINIFVGKGFLIEDQDNRELMLIHEITHIFISPLYKTFDEVLDAVTDDPTSKQLAHDRWDQFEERAVCDISYVIHNLLKEVENARAVADA